MSFRYQKYLVLFISAIVIGLGALLWRPFSAGYYYVFVVTYDQYDYPFVTAEFQGQNIPLAVRIGSRFPLSLRKETLDKIDKQPHGTVVRHTFDGGQYEALSFLIPEIKIGSLNLKNIIASQTLGEDSDILGKFFGEEFNLLLDFPHSRIIACDSFAKLEAKNLVEKDWLRIPFNISPSGPIFDVNTDFGKCSLVINTASTRGCIRSSLVAPESSPVSLPIFLGEESFGKATFQPAHFPDGLSDIDGFIGMDFLKRHAIYLDYASKTAYVQPSETYFERLPVTLGNRGLFTTNVAIGGNTYSLEIDLGSYFAFTLNEGILDGINKIPYGTARWKDFSGRKYESPIYSAQEVKIGNLSFDHVLIRQDREDFHVNVALDSVSSQPLGAIGRPILEKYNLFLDFPHSAIYASNKHLPLQQDGLFSQNLLVVPFILHPDGILLSVETDTGSKRLLLDTGATHTAIRTPHATVTTQFRLMEHDFGERSIISINLDPSLDYDGFLGLDFLRENPLFIDYQHRRIYLDLEKSRIDSVNTQSL